MIALMPNRSDCRFRVEEFFTFLLSKSSLNSLAFSTKYNVNPSQLTVSGLSSIVTSRVEQISVQLILEQISDRIRRHIILLCDHSWLLLLIGLVLKASLQWKN